jgi:hypothetical protein
MRAHAILHAGAPCGVTAWFISSTIRGAGTIEVQRQQWEKAWAGVRWAASLLPCAHAVACARLDARLARFLLRVQRKRIETNKCLSPAPA